MWVLPVRGRDQVQLGQGKKYSPRMQEGDKAKYLKGWDKAIQRSLGWGEGEGEEDKAEVKQVKKQKRSFI